MGRRGQQTGGGPDSSVLPGGSGGRDPAHWRSIPEHRKRLRGPEDLPLHLDHQPGRDDLRSKIHFATGGHCCGNGGHHRGTRKRTRNERKHERDRHNGEGLHRGFCGIGPADQRGGYHGRLHGRASRYSGGSSTQPPCGGCCECYNQRCELTATTTPAALCSVVLFGKTTINNRRTDRSITRAVHVVSDFGDAPKIRYVRTKRDFLILKSFDTPF
mmetsp:Transcript_8425/g.18171  ORF Transcript_8425/g.18171 Transcript_8425/m.18171 type:complete len:215 (+) Transcript_8425:1506-2150(+)